MVNKTRVRKKKKDLDHTEKLELEIRELKALNRTLMKRLKKVDRDFRKIEDLEAELEDYHKQEDFTPKKKVCPSCTRGAIIEVDLGTRTLRRCELACGWRETKKV